MRKELEDGADEAVENEMPELTQADSQADGGAWMIYVTSGAVAVVMALLTSLGVWFAQTGGKPPTRFAVVDLAGILELQQLALQASVMGKNVTDTDRYASFEKIKSFGPMLEKSIEATRLKCQCVLLARNAYIGPADMDMTEEVKRGVGLGGVTRDAIKAEISQKLTEALPGNEGDLLNGKR